MYEKLNLKIITNEKFSWIIQHVFVGHASTNIIGLVAKPQSAMIDRSADRIGHCDWPIGHHVNAD